MPSTSAKTKELVKTLNPDTYETTKGTKQNCIVLLSCQGARDLVKIIKKIGIRDDAYFTETTHYLSSFTKKMDTIKTNNELTKYIDAFDDTKKQLQTSLQLAKKN